jgi:toxin ParE1/3/4
MVVEVRAGVERLTDFPLSGRIVPERKAHGYREIIVAPYRIVYSVVGDDVRILRVWHGRRSMGP